MRSLRFRLRTLIFAVAGVAAVLPLGIEAGRIWALQPGRPWNSRLRAGQEVVTAGEEGVGASGGPAQLASGTRCLVARETAWDDDSCYTGRSILVRVVDGKWAGQLMEVPRDRLRPIASDELSTR